MTTAQAAQKCANSDGAKIAASALGLAKNDRGTNPRKKAKERANEICDARESDAPVAEPEPVHYEPINFQKIDPADVEMVLRLDMPKVLVWLSPWTQWAKIGNHGCRQHIKRLGKNTSLNWYYFVPKKMLGQSIMARVKVFDVVFTQTGSDGSEKRQPHTIVCVYPDNGRDKRARHVIRLNDERDTRDDAVVLLQQWGNRWFVMKEIPK